MKWLNPLEWDVGVTLVAVLGVGAIAAALVLGSPAVQSQTVHPDIMWLYRMIDGLDARIKKLEEAQNR